MKSQIINSSCHTAVHTVAFKILMIQHINQMNVQVLFYMSLKKNLTAVKFIIFSIYFKFPYLSLLSFYFERYFSLELNVLM